jgi:hypothetical protein
VPVCADPEFVPSPEYTRLRCGEIELSNALESVRWFESPAVQVVLCEDCGYPGCESGGYVHVSRLGAHVLWTRPHVDESNPLDAYQYRAAEPVRTYGAVAIRAKEWDSWGDRLPDWPSAESFPPTTRHDLFAAWYLEAPLSGTWDAPERLVTLTRERVLSTNPSELGDALDGLAALVAWFTDDADAAVNGELVSVTAEGATLETLYVDIPDTFDRPVLREWPAYSRRGDLVTPVFGGGLVLFPEPAALPASA